MRKLGNLPVCARAAAVATRTLLLRPPDLRQAVGLKDSFLGLRPHLGQSRRARGRSTL